MIISDDLHCSGCDRLQPLPESTYEPTCSTMKHLKNCSSNISSSKTEQQPQTTCYNKAKFTTTLPTTHLLRTVLLILLLLIDKGLSLTTTDIHTPVITNFQDIREFQDTSVSRYYRYFQMDTRAGDLYVGAMNYLYKLNLNDISQIKDLVNLPYTDAAYGSCILEGIRDHGFDCQNHIRSVIITDNVVQVCGTGAFLPRFDVLHKSDLSVRESALSGRGMCPYDPNDNATSIYITSGNPGGVATTYTAGTVVSVHDPVIYRPPLTDSQGMFVSSLLRTMQQDTKWLNQPQFVGSFDVGQYVYFFFRESALEYTNCGKAIFSRVARVCKNDLGGPGVLEYKWSTFLKARLNCSISGEFPLYFNAIYDVKRVGSSFYAVFSTNNVDGLFGSAVCAFTEADIDSAFRGTFKEQVDSGSLWLPVSEGKIPSQRPGQCINDSRQLPDNVVQFIRHRPLMDEAVTHSNTPAGTPLYYNSGVIYNSFAIDRPVIDGVSCDVYFLGTTHGHIHKVVQWNEGGLEKNRLITIWKPFGDGVVTIWKMEIHNGHLYVSTDDSVKQIPLEQCETYQECKDCAHDPYCGWHKWNKRCQLRSNEAKNSVKSENAINICTSSTCKKQDGVIVQNVRIPGDPIYFHCDSHCPTDSVVWYKNATQIQIDSIKYFLSKDNGLMIFNITTPDRAIYSCRDASNDVELVMHELVMPECGDDRMCLWQEEFRNWCSEFDSYKKQFNNWVCLKDACIGEETCMPQGVSDMCPLSP